ncbi:MAG: guanylate kinase [Gammaproteobacteria bacterium]|nr:guanylate kinase [Gammaproteobacteria bacterium]
MSSRGSLIILSAPSGGGKSSLAKALREANANISVSVSHTTRAPRPGEVDGVDYHFVTPEAFQTMVQAGDFLEYAKVFDNYYGTSRAAVETELAQGKHVLLDIDWQGMREIKAQWADAISIFILPPSKEALEQRLRGRGQDSEEIIARRMRDAVSEMNHCHEFDFLVVNDVFDSALADLMAIIEGYPEQARRITLDIEDLLAN